MAGTFTHMTIAWKALRDDRLPIELRRLLRRHKKYLYLGSFSPDLPFTVLKGDIADMFHRERTQLFIDDCFNSSKGDRSVSDSAREARYAWLLGYVSHIVADVIIHPIVAEAAGPVTDPDTGTNHRECEMIQDAFIYKTIRGRELDEVEFIDVVRNVIDAPQTNDVLNIFSDSMHHIYGLDANPWELSLWIGRFLNVVDAIEDGDGIAKLSRHVFDVAPTSILLQNTETIINEMPDEYQKYYDSITLPGGTVGSFMVDGFEKTVHELVSVWIEMDTKWRSNEEAFAGVIPDWNLDTGRDMITDQSAYWG